MKRIPACDGWHAFAHSVTHEAAFDLGRYARIVGMGGEHRYLCAACAEGRLSPKFHERYAIERPHTCAGCDAYAARITA